MTWTLVKGHKGPVKGLRALGPQGLDPLFTHTHTQSLDTARVILKTYVFYIHYMFRASLTLEYYY
jgi:hypothetical protein